MALLTQQCSLLQIHWTQPIWSALHMPIYNIYVRLGHILWWINSSYTSAWCSSSDTEELSNLHNVISFWSTTPRKKHLTNGSTKSQICNSDQLVPNFNILLTLVISILFPVLTIFVFHFLQECVFKKISDKTGLRVFWSGTLRIHNCHGCCRRWFFTFNGAECSAPAAIDGVVYMVHGNSDKKDLHRVRQIEGVCEKVHKGTVRVGFWVGSCAGVRSADAYTGWNSVSRIYVEEIPPPQA